MESAVTSIGKNAAHGANAGCMRSRARSLSVQRMAAAASRAARQCTGTETAEGNRYPSAPPSTALHSRGYGAAATAATANGA